MPGKRKRDDADEHTRSSQQAQGAGNKQTVEGKIHHGKQLLYRALKLAKGFERQKLSRRQKKAETEKNDADLQRINAEIEALKNLDLHAASAIHIHKAILKEKAMRDSPLLPSYVPEKAKVNLNNATANITARLWASAPVKKVMPALMTPIRIAIVGHASKDGNGRTTKLGIMNTVETSLGQTKIPLDDDDDDDDADLAAYDDRDRIESTPNDEDAADDTDVEIGEEDFTAFDDRIGGSSDDESLDLEAAKANAANRRPADLSLTPSPSPSPSASAAESGQDEYAASIASSSSQTDNNTNLPTPKSKPSKPKPPNPRQSNIFLPSLTSGYLSGSDESASDLDADAPPTHKNRRGQRARQKIWEAKYGAKAKHVGNATQKNGGRDQGWDMKRGAQAEGEQARFKGRSLGAKKVVTGANMQDVVPRPGRVAAAAADARRDTRADARRETRADAPNRAARRAAGGLSAGGVKKLKDKDKLHPSWEAARKAKEAKAASVGFAGTKVTFD